EMRLAEKRQQMMLAQRVKIEVLAQDDFLVLFFAEYRAIYRHLRIIAIAAGQELQGVAHAAWRQFQALALGILAYMAHDQAHGVLDRGIGRAFLSGFVLEIG